MVSRTFGGGLGRLGEQPHERRQRFRVVGGERDGAAQLAKAPACARRSASRAVALGSLCRASAHANRLQLRRNVTLRQPASRVERRRRRMHLSASRHRGQHDLRRCRYRNGASSTAKAPAAPSPHALRRHPPCGHGCACARRRATLGDRRASRAPRAPLISGRFDAVSDARAATRRCGRLPRAPER